jgi:hypothetical protein
MLARELVDRKLIEQRRIVHESFKRADVTHFIEQLRSQLPTAGDLTTLRILESQAAHAYWSCWRAVPVMFPKADLPRVPEHWRTFGARISPLTGSPRLSVNPPNAMLNYVYAIVEAEARLAATALGLDPGLGVMHFDADARDSLACDLMEPVRPLADAFVLNWIMGQPLRREWFFEERNGNCRLMAPFAERLGQTAATWAQAVAPVAERVAKALWNTVRKGTRLGRGTATRLTQQHRREAKAAPPIAVQQPPAPPCVCRDCGTAIARGVSYCARCWTKAGREQTLSALEKARLNAHVPRAQARRAATQRRQRASGRAWKPSDLPGWLTERTYQEKIQPRLGHLSKARIARVLEISIPYALRIRSGRCRPHPRHWKALAGLAGVPSPT